MISIFSIFACIYCVCSNIYVNSNVVDYKPCPQKLDKEERTLHILTCDTKSGYREYHALKCKFY